MIDKSVLNRLITIVGKDDILTEVEDLASYEDG